MGEGRVGEKGDGGGKGGEREEGKSRRGKARRMEEEGAEKGERMQGGEAPRGWGGSLWRCLDDDPCTAKARSGDTGRVQLQVGLSGRLVNAQFLQPPHPPAERHVGPEGGASAALSSLPPTTRGLKVSPLFSVVMTVASSGSPQPCLVLADSLKMYADSGASSVAVNCLTVAPTSTVVKVLGLLLARR